MSRVMQFVPTFESGGVGSHMLEAQKALRGAGYESEIYADQIRSEVKGLAQPFSAYEADAQPNDVLIYQMAIGSGLADSLKNRDEVLIVNHHNLTPIEYLEPWEGAATYGVSWGIRQLHELAPRASLGIGVSGFNRDELIDAGYSNTCVVPFLFDAEKFSVHADSQTRQKLASLKERGGTDLLFVGRVSPHKCHHDLIKSFAVYRDLYDADARLHLVGSSASSGYSEFLEKFASSLGVSDAVFLTGSVTDAQLSAYYEAADAFVIASEHEGFCVPLLEAMFHKVPVIAYASSAIPETAGQATLLLKDKSPAVFAAAVSRVINDAQLRTQLLNAGTQRLGAFDISKTSEEFVIAVESVMT